MLSLLVAASIGGNIEFVFCQTLVTTAGFYLTWETFDWGRRHNKVVEATKTVEQARNGIQETQWKVAAEVGREVP